MSRLPNFFLVGAPKTATTSLYHYLDQHPQVFMSAIKEPHYFAAEVREDNFEPQLRLAVARDAREVRQFLAGPMSEKRFGGTVTDWDDYLRLFANAKADACLGEASVCYLWSPSAPERIAERIPEAKILVMLRDPAERAFAQYMHGLQNGAIRWSFREHIDRNMRHRSGQLSVHYPFLEFGLYSEQIERYRALFGHNVWIGLQEDLTESPLELYQSICRFLGVDSNFWPDMEQRHLEHQVPRTHSLGWCKEVGLWEASAKLTPAALRPLIRRALVREPGTTHMDAADRQYLLDFYREDVGRVAQLLNRDLDAWLN